MGIFDSFERIGRNLDSSINILKAIPRSPSSSSLWRYVRSILIEFASITRSNAERMRGKIEIQRNQSRRISFHRGDNSTRIFRVEFRIFTRQPRITGSINAKRRV